MHAALAPWREGRGRSGRWLTWSSLVVAAALAVAWLFSRGTLSPRERLLAAGMHRPTPGRLFGEASYRPPGARSKDGSASHHIAAILGIGAMDAPDLLDQAVIDLMRGDLVRAIAGLDLASRAQPTAREALTDLSAVYLARFEAEHDCLDLLRAIEAADRGLMLQPDDPTLLFNRATALSRLGTRMLAERAWQRFTRTGTKDGWRVEAETRQRELRQPGADAEWKRALARVDSPAVSPAEVEAITSRLPAQARAFAEEQLLPRWASAAAAGDAAKAEHSLRLAVIIGDVLRRSRGEELLADAVSSIRRTIGGGSAADRAALIHGLQNFGAGVAHYNDHNLTSAREPLTRAVTDLTAVDHPLRHWARFYLAIGEYYEDAQRGAVLLETLWGDIPADRYPALAGRIDWIAGTIEKVQGRIQSSVRRYERSAAALQRAGGGHASAFANVLLAESYTLLGEHSLAWEKRLVAFHDVPLSESPRRRIAMWTEAKEALVRQGNLTLGGPFVDEAVANAELWNMPLGRVVAYLDRAAYRIGIGAHGTALSDLRQAQAAIAKMEPSSLRDQQSYIALITEGLCQRATDPVRAATLLQDGLGRQGATGKRFDAITYMTALADAQIAAGDPAAGAASLERALAIFEDIRATVEDPVSRMQAFRQAQPAFDRLIELRITEPGADREEVFRLAERSRARVLLELRAADHHVEFARLADLEKLLPRGVALVSYVVLNDRVLAWVVEDGRTRQVTLRTSRDDLEAAIERFRLELRRGGGMAAIRETAAPLYDYLIRPLDLPRGAEQSLIIIPDWKLARLPFAALFDRAAGQYLIQERAVAIAPSATLLVRSSHEPAPRPASEPTLVIGVSRPGEWRGRSLPALTRADREAARVAALYPDAALLRGRAATRENFLERSISSNVIHFAGHAVVDLEAPGRSVLLFADGASSGLKPLSLGELFDRGLGHARLVVLAACGTQDSLADDREGLLGLAGAFIAAGAAEVVASPLDVHDDSSAQVMVAFHRHYQKDRFAAVAFRHAVTELLRSRSETSSPAAWGGFTVIQGSFERRRNAV
jgi:CHAT domain-containing protein